MLRTVTGLMYLAGGCIHLFLGLRKPELYREFEQTALIAPYRQALRRFVSPQPRTFALLAAATEFVLAGLIFSSGGLRKVGLLGSAALQLALIPLGWWGFLNIPLAGLSLLALRGQRT